jgi:hypothetical protein
VTDLHDRCAHRVDLALTGSGFGLSDFPIDRLAAWRLIRAAYGCAYTDALALDLGDLGEARAFEYEHLARLPIPD